MEYTAFNHAAWNPLHSIGMLWAMLQKNPLHSIGMHWASLHGLQCIQSGSIAPQCMESSAFNDAAWNPLHSITLHGVHCIQYGCILPGCMEYTAFNHNAWIHCIQTGCFGPCCIKSTAFNHAAWNPLHSIMQHKIRCIP